ncbi:hypothetical protein DZF91_29795 [Actinomadura logoneensis]|uniref:Up-regulated in Daf-2 domain-containing protein n=1 Tax=Actinomadura logoneensis TaxID=2293572 RepID=A0A372JDI6_9ACTN|nr:hypothetical protein DZF91_29795 [Actinomadura logoneensis]
MKVTVNTGAEVTNLHVQHRYDRDHYDDKEWTEAKDGDVLTGLSATFWTGFIRTGVDYWWIKFTCEGKTYTCKDDFYCYLTADDGESGGPVMITFSRGSMTVNPPKSSSCQVTVYET